MHPLCPGGQKKTALPVEIYRLCCWTVYVTLLKTPHFFCWYPPFCLVIKSRQIKSILGYSWKIIKKVSNPFCLELSKSFRNQKKSPSFDDLDHPSSKQMGHVQGPGDWSGTQTAAVPGKAAAQGSHWLILKIDEDSPLMLQTWKSVQHWYTKIRGFLRTCTKKNMWDFKYQCFLQKCDSL